LPKIETAAKMLGLTARHLVFRVLVAVGLASALVAPHAARADELAHPTLAYYYAWWGPRDFERTLFQPGQAYDSDDPGMIERHVQQAQAAGIEGFVMSWYGSGDRTDRNLGQLLDIAQRSGFAATVHVETPHFASADDVVANLRAFYASRANQPAMLRYQGRPVIFFWRASTFDNETWNAIRAQVDPDREAIWIADGDQFSILAGEAWDGISPYAIAWSRNPAAQLPAWAAKARAVAPDKLWIPPVSPGCDDSAARPATCVQDRADGAYYQATWDGALASRPNWAVIVSTFNEWLESTQIEPSVQYGEQYLQITARYAEQLAGS
jgi:Glycosyl hydrolase family 99